MDSSSLTDNPFPVDSSSPTDTSLPPDTPPPIDTSSPSDSLGPSTTTDEDTPSQTSSVTPSPYSYTGNDPTINHLPVCNGDNNTQYTDIFAANYDVKCGISLDGQQGLAAHADAFVDCMEYCDILEGCAAVTFLPNPEVDDANCYPYLEFYGYDYSTTTDLWSAVPTDGPTTGEDFTQDLCRTTNDYDSYNQSVYTDLFGNNYFIGCNESVNGAGYGGHDMASTVTTTLLGCVTYCSTYQHCTGLDWIGFVLGQNQANCFPKATTGDVSFFI